MSAGQIILQRLRVVPPLLLGMTLIVFLITHYVPGDPLAANLGEQARNDPELVATFRAKWGLDKPLHIQYLAYLGNLIRGDLGTSIRTKEPVTEDLRRYFPASVELAIVATMFSIIVGIPLGVISAVHRNQPIDHIARLLSLTGVAAPIFWLALVTLNIFYLQLGWAPGPGRLDTGMEEPTRVTGLFTIDSLLEGNTKTLVSAVRHLLLPGLVLGSATTGLITRMMRSSMLDVLSQPYIRTARSKGLGENAVLFRHAIRNALIPTVTVLGLSMGSIMAGTVLTETIFSWPGVGRYAYNSAVTLDIPAIMGVTLLIAVIFITANLVVDVLYVFLDPRLRS